MQRAVEHLCVKQLNFSLASMSFDRRGRGRGRVEMSSPISMWHALQDLCPELREVVQSRRVVAIRASE